MEVVAVFVIVLIILGICFALFLLTATPSGEESSTQAFTTVDFIPNQMYQDNSTGSGIAINEETKKLCLIKSANSPPRLFHFTDLLGSALVKNGITLEKTTRTSPEEIMVAAKELEKKTKSFVLNKIEPTSQGNSIQKIDLWVLVNDKEDSFHVVNFLDMDAKEGGLIYDKAMSTAKHWHHLLSGLLDQADSQEFLVTPPSKHDKNSPTKNITDVTSVTEELTKLGVLLDKKLITQEEFNTQKEKLLAAKS